MISKNVEQVKKRGKKRTEVIRSSFGQGIVLEKESY